jgi:hypothetical protein
VVSVAGSTAPVIRIRDPFASFYLDQARSRQPAAPCSGASRKIYTIVPWEGAPCSRPSPGFVSEAPVCGSLIRAPTAFVHPRVFPQIRISDAVGRLARPRRAVKPQRRVGRAEGAWLDGDRADRATIYVAPMHVGS